MYIGWFKEGKPWYKGKYFFTNGDTVEGLLKDWDDAPFEWKSGTYISIKTMCAYTGLFLSKNQAVGGQLVWMNWRKEPIA